MDLMEVITELQGEMLKKIKTKTIIKTKTKTKTKKMNV